VMDRLKADATDGPPKGGHYVMVRLKADTT
jgi:hypothetical protein